MDRRVFNDLSNHVIDRVESATTQALDLCDNPVDQLALLTRIAMQALTNCVVLGVIARNVQDSEPSADAQHVAEDQLRLVIDIYFAGERHNRIMRVLREQMAAHAVQARSEKA